MKIIRVSVEGINLFKNKVDIDFYAEKRVLSDNAEMVSNLFGKFYTNNVLSVVGINASGKTSLLKLLSFVFHYLNGKSINDIEEREVFTDSKEVLIEAVFYSKEKGICKLSSKIVRKRVNMIEEKYEVEEEKLYIKNINKVKSKKDLITFNEGDLIKIRDEDNEYLQDDVSIVSSISKNDNLHVRSLLRLTNINFLVTFGDFPQELLKFLDPSIEYLSFNKETEELELKFYNRKPIKLVNPLLLEKYLSSGTIKGINVFINAMIAFKEGGYLIIDEIENHFNTEIVAVLLRFFMNQSVNKKGATLVFSTHYSELLDEIDRNDNIYIARNHGGITLQKLCEALKRNDIKKSDAFKSDFLNGTAPSYDSYMGLMKVIKNHM
ncbi:AAA family ATPase [Kandleria sp.]|uniref:AAA family ATPase n=1 Tax=Kandleria sp. TaxID=2774291 RepID=UPI001B471E57|nr:AAA family ATPase [Kandleria sp.]MBP3275230.1 AAA family ATPase [Kandleria sp.]